MGESVGNCSNGPLCLGLSYFKIVTDEIRNHTVIIIRIYNLSCHLQSNFCDIGKKWCCRHICVGEVLLWIFCRRSYVAFTPPERERLCLALQLFFMGQDGRWSCNFVKHNLVQIYWSRVVSLTSLSVYHCSFHIKYIQNILLLKKIPY